ncbi:helix-turn-helix transcriptional regulator [Candidatus Bipolaricaulota bacterium]|nr:helix-turn-helix transcriptional regulator [Candidatus Bipolaricaulota bacterium]MBS3813774.1 helix-turn-helix transcriptional regulator [Candidatus Bipolaricaulota bacterium]MBS3825001.1 helix-turn-helix transcriptional regulator [Candidatus Bipolaricaulota bacterium]
MSDRTRILTALGAGKTIDEMAETLDMRKQTIKAMIDLLQHQGLIKEVDCSRSCNSCPMSKSCPVPATGREKLYVVTEEKEDYSGD